MNIKRTSYRLFFLVAVLSLNSCNNGKKPIETTEAEVIPEDIVEMREDQIKLAEIQLGSFETRSMSNNLRVSGKVSVPPQNRTAVSLPMGGIVRQVRLIAGNRVQKGQTLALVENPDFIDIQQQYLEARNNSDLAKAEFDRQSALYQSDAASQKSLQQITASYKSSRVQVKALEQKLLLIGINPFRLTEENITRSVAVKAPISGYIQTVTVSSGQSVTPSDILFEIVNNDQLYLELSLYEKDVEKVNSGEPLHFYINNETDTHEAVVTQTSKSVNDDRTYAVFARVQGKCPNMVPGMYVNAMIQSRSNRVTAVPSEAIVTFEDKDYLFVFENNKVENGNKMTEYRMIQVKKGVSEAGFTAVELPQNEQPQTLKLVVKGAYNLLSAKKNAGEMSC